MTELDRLNVAVNELAVAMKERFAQMERAGYAGWDGAHSEEDLLQQIEDDSINIGLDADDDKQLCIDIANRAMMIFWRRAHGAQ